MRDLTSDFEPTIILHHAHSTDSPRIWATAWSGAREFPSGERSPATRLGVGYWLLQDDGDREPRGALCDVRGATRCCASHVIDIVVEPSN